jgi:hypothetical protein
MVNKWPGTSEYTDLCFTCLSMCSDDSEWEDFDLDHIAIDELPESLECIHGLDLVSNNHVG